MFCLLLKSLLPSVEAWKCTFPLPFSVQHRIMIQDSNHCTCPSEASFGSSLLGNKYTLCRAHLMNIGFPGVQVVIVLTSGPTTDCQCWWSCGCSQVEFLAAGISYLRPVQGMFGGHWSWNLRHLSSNSVSCLVYF